MFTLRGLAIVLTGAGVFAGLSLTDAQACDNDRFPCPVASEALPQETIAEPAPAAQPRKKAEHPSREAAPKRADTVAKPAPSAQPPKKAAKHLAPPNEKAQAKVEPAAPREATGAKASQPAVQEQAAAPFRCSRMRQLPRCFLRHLLIKVPTARTPVSWRLRDRFGRFSRMRMPAARQGPRSRTQRKLAGQTRYKWWTERRQQTRSSRHCPHTGRVVLDHLCVVDLGRSIRGGTSHMVRCSHDIQVRADSGSTHAHEQLVNEKVTYSQSRCRPAANADARLSEAAMIVSRQTRPAAKSGIRSSTIG